MVFRGRMPRGGRGPLRVTTLDREEQRVEVDVEEKRKRWEDNLGIR